jgi:hypothetical protein
MLSATGRARFFSRALGDNSASLRNIGVELEMR